MAKSVQLTAAIEQYERHMTARGLAVNTVKNNVQVLRRAHAVWGDILVSSITPDRIDALFAHYGWRESTRNLYLSQLNSFFAWARRHKMMPKDACPTDGWRAVRAPRRDRLRIPVEQFPAMLDAADHPRDRAVIALGMFTFLRGSEIQTLRVRDLDLTNNTLRVYRHKTRESDMLPVSRELHAEMERWLRWYRSDAGILSPHWFLVPSKAPNYTGYDPETQRIFVDTTRLAPLRPEKQLHQPYTVVQRSLTKLGYDTYWEGEHTLRRSGARALADALRAEGYDGALMRVASMLGHKDTRVTERYIGWELERTQRNEAIAGQTMFPAMPTADARVVSITRGA